MSTLYKIAKRNIERQPKPLSAEFIADMQDKIDKFAADGKITAEEYEDLCSMLTSDMLVTAI